MEYLLVTLYAEIKKVYQSIMLWITIIIFTIATLMASLMIYILKDPILAEEIGLLGSKAHLYGEANWETFLLFFMQMIALGGLIVFGFVISWLFGREFVDGTIKNLLALPYARFFIVLAKYIVSIIVSFLLAIYMVSLGIILGFILDVPHFSMEVLFESIGKLFIVTLMTISLSFPVAFFASIGRGYLLPIGFVILMIILSQFISALGYGGYFPWAIPAIYSGIAGPDQDYHLTPFIVTVLFGLGLTFFWWEYAEQS